MMLHETLWAANQDLARANLEHPFVRGLADGSLAADAFKRYVAQDAFYIRAFVQAYALAAARCARIEDVRRLHRLMGAALDELQLHSGYAARLGIDLHRVEPLPACRTYTDFLLATAWQSEPGQTIAAMTPCVRLYAWLGQQLAAAGVPQHAYAEWIRNYSSPEFEAFAREIESLLDEQATDSPAVRDAYRYAMQCELAFFAAPLEAAT